LSHISKTSLSEYVQGALIKAN